MTCLEFLRPAARLCEFMNSGANCLEPSASCAGKQELHCVNPGYAMHSSLQAHPVRSEITTSTLQPDMLNT
jgi:hypothetical protein